MTDLERIEAALKDVVFSGNDRAPAIEAITLLVADVRRETIEACAKIADEEGDSYDGDASQIAADRIRALLTGSKADG